MFSLHEVVCSESIVDGLFSFLNSKLLGKYNDGGKAFQKLEQLSALLKYSF